MEGNSQITAKLESSVPSFPNGSIYFANTSPPTSFSHGATLFKYSLNNSWLIIFVVDIQ